MPLRRRSRGVSNAPHTTTTASAVTVCSTPSASRYRTPRLARAAAVHQDLEGQALGPDLAVTAQQRPAQHGDRVALGVDRAAVEGAEAAVVAGRPSVVRDAVGAGGGAVGVVAERLGGRDGERGEEHVGTGRHGVRRAAPRRERIGGVVARHADETLGVRVVRLHLVVVDGPVGDVGALHGPELRREPEVDLAVARELAVGVVPGAAHRRRHVVDVAGEASFTVRGRTAVRAGLEQGVGPEEVPAVELDLVVREVTKARERWLQREEVVATLLQDAHRLPRPAEHVGRGRPARAGTDDHHVEVRHRSPRRRSSPAAGRRRRTRWRANRRAHGSLRTRARRSWLRTRARTGADAARGRVRGPRPAGRP